MKFPSFGRWRSFRALESGFLKFLGVFDKVCAQFFCHLGCLCELLSKIWACSVSELSEVLAWLWRG